MPLIEEIVDSAPAELRTVPVNIDRHTLAHRRWRARAEDGTDFAVNLETPCSSGSVLFATGEVAYVVQQASEAVIDIPLPALPPAAARLGWFLGNQHLPVQITPDCIRIEAEPLLLEKLDREHIHYHVKRAVFEPAPHSAGHAHESHHPPHTHADA